jgi:transcriptional regulator with PAS, ATPase and Fis domain
MPAPTQAKLLRILEDSKVRRLGGKTEFEVDVRVLAATNKIPGEAVKKGSLREDLYYRLNVFHIHLPPLRDRKEDIPLIGEALITLLNSKHECRVTGVSQEVQEIFQEYNWPGNVRELRNALERAVIMAGQGLIERKHLPATFTSPEEEELVVDSDCVQFRVGATVEQAERGLILKTLEHTKNNKTKAAEILGISLKTLHNKLKEYGATATAGE